MGFPDSGKVIFTYRGNFYRVTFGKSSRKNHATPRIGVEDQRS